ncbi:MAG TPA: hypothetical protein VF426_12420 [Marmoricola sp.]
MAIGTKLIGWIFLIATAIGFVTESAPVFLVAVVLLLAWVGYVLRPSHD